MSARYAITGSGTPPAQDRDDAMPADAGANLEPQVPHGRRDDPGRAFLESRDLRMPMQVAPEFHQARGIADDHGLQLLAHRPA